MKLIDDGEPIKLAQLAPGTLFKFHETIALKSEYFSDNGAPQSYILGSGELFWGGVQTAAQINDLLVQPLKFVASMTTVDKFLAGIHIIRKYDPDPELAVGHDVIFFGSYEVREDMTLLDQQQMEDLGWYERQDSWTFRV